MSANLANLTKTEAIEKLNTAKRAISRWREQNNKVVQRGVNVVVGGAGGFASGVLDDRVPEIGGLPTSGTVGLGLALLGVVDGAGSASESLIAFGTGMLAGSMRDQGTKFSRNLKI